MNMSSMGTKTFITGGTLADYLLVLCVTEPHAKSRHDRFSVIMVETDRKGFEASKLKTSLAFVLLILLKSLSAMSKCQKRISSERLEKDSSSFMVFLITPAST